MGRRIRAQDAIRRRFWMPPLLLALCAPPVAEADQFDDRLARADSLLVARSSAEALRILDSLQVESRAEGSDARLLRVRLTEARLHGYAGRPAAGRAAAEEAVRIASTRRDTLAVCDGLRWLAVAAQLEGKFEESREHAGRFVALAASRRDRLREGAGLVLLGYADLILGRAESAEQEYERAAELLEDAGDLNSYLMALTGLGRLRDRRGDAGGARDCYLRVLEESRKVKNPFGEADALNNLGALEFIYGDPSLARGYYQQALEIQIENGNPGGSIIPAKNLALTCTYMGEFDEAAGILLDAELRCDQLGHPGQKALVLEQLGIVRREQGRLGEASGLLRRAAALVANESTESLGHILIDLAETLQYDDSLEAGIAVLKGPFGKIRRLVSAELDFKAERTQGEILLRLGRRDEARGHFLRAGRIGRESGLRYQVAPLTYLARCHALEGRPDSARIYLARAVTAWESERSRIRDPAWRAQLDLDGRLLHTELAHVAFADAAPGSPAQRSRLAFDALQRFKARTLRERMLGHFSTRPDSTAGEDLGPVTLADLQERWLAPDEVLLDYFLGTDGIYLFGITREECRARRIPVDPKTLQTALRRYRDMAARPPAVDPQGTDANLLAAAGARLSSLLLSPVADLLRSHGRIIIAPDGHLNMIPLESLPLSNRDGDSASVRPLAAWRDVSRTPSVSLFRDQRRRARVRPPAALRPRLLALLGRGTPEDPSIPGAYGEVAWLARTYRDVRVHEASADTAARAWRTDLARSEVIHLASHVRADDVHPWRSGLPALRAQEIAEMRLPARLAVLAGCESAGGRIVSGEGVVGLTAAFTAATVPTVIATLWPISDRVTAGFMKIFYLALADGRPAGASLREAQLRIREDPRTSHPFYWAGFVLVGDADAVIPLQRRFLPQPLSGLLAAAALLAALAAVLLRVRRKNL
jgi:CHAT domain-containing protein